MRYSHGGDIYTYGEVVDFSVNVNPLGMSEHVAEAAKREPIQTVSAENCGKNWPGVRDCRKPIMYSETERQKFSIRWYWRKSRSRLFFPCRLFPNMSGR